MATTGDWSQLRVVQPGQEVGRPRAGDREARCRAARELAVGTRGEGRGPFVPDPDEDQLTAGLGAPECVGESQVRVPDHPEDAGHAVGDERLHEHVGHRPSDADGLGHADVDTVIPLLQLVDSDGVAEGARRPPGQRVVVVAVPRTAEQPLLDRALTQRPTLVRTPVLQSSQRSATPRQREAAPVDGDAANPAVTGHVGLADAMPGAGGHLGRHMF
jgi:hypothetical protein